MKHRTQSTLANRIPAPARRQKLGPAGTIILSVALAVIAIAMLLIGFAPSAGATNTPSTRPTGGHTPVVVCHNREHNPVVIVVDDDSAKLQGHLLHRVHPQLRDLVEGYDGTADQVRALCVKQVTTPPTETTSTTTPPPSTTTTSTGTPTFTTTGTHTKNPVVVKPRHTNPPTGHVKAPVKVTPRHTLATTPRATQPVLAYTGPITPQALYAGIVALLLGAACTVLAKRMVDTDTTHRRH